MSSVTYTAFGGGTVQNLYIYSGGRTLVASEARDKDTNRSIDDNDRQQVKMLMLTLKLRCCHWQTVCGSRLTGAHGEGPHSGGIRANKIPDTYLEPASSRSTRMLGSSEMRDARTHPAVPVAVRCK